LAPNEKGTRSMRRSLAKLTGSTPRTSTDRVILRTHEALARAPSVLLAATLDDVLAVPDRPNMPGTTDQYPCWCIPLPRTLEQITRDPRATRIARALTRKSRAKNR
jgi:4-alpha-glucanotransferase